MMRASKQRSSRAGPGLSPLATKVFTGMGVGLLGLLVLAMTVFLPAATTASSLSSAPFQRNAFGAGHRELLDVKEETASNGRSFLQYQTRRNWAAEEVSSEFCSYDATTEDCNWSDYAQSLSLLATPPAIIGLFFFFFYIILFCGRCCCVMSRCCMLPWTGSSLEPWIMRVMLLVLAVFILGMAVMAHVGNAWAHEGVNNLGDDAGDYATTIVNITNNAADLLVRLDSSQQSTADTAKSDAADVSSNVNDFKDYLEKVETARFVVFLVTFIVIFGIGISALSSICCFRRPTFCANYWYAVVLFVPIFVVMAFCIVFGAGASDVCSAYDGAQANSTNNIFSKILGSAWGVDCAALQDLIDPLFKEYNDTLTQLCTEYNTTCSSYPGVSNCQTCSATSDVSALKQTDITETFYCNDSPLYCLDTAICSTNGTAMCYQQTQTFDQCVTQCLDPNNRNVTNQTVYYVDLAVEVNQTIIEITPYVGCGLITEFVDATDYSLCVEFIAGDFLVVVATIVLGFLWIFYELVVILAYERAGMRPDKDDF